jgi:site-specific DNA recombinase
MADAPKPLSLLEQTLAERAIAGARRLRAVIYARRSYDPNGLARAIGDQTHEGRATCERLGWDVVGEFADPDNSASRHARKERPDYDDMVKRVEAGEVDVIVTWESTRLSRDITVFTRLADLCERTGVQLCLNGSIYNMRDPHQRFFAQFSVLQGGLEADTMRARALRTMAALARDGRPGGFTPYGFAREYDPVTGKLVRQYPDPEAAPIVAELTHRVAAGESLLMLARDMKKRGVPTPRDGSEWKPMTVRKLVLRASNVGKRVHQGRVVADAIWPAIVSEVDYHAAVKLLSDPERSTTKDTAVKYLLTGITFCPAGHKLRVQGGAQQRRRRYMCTECFGASIGVETFDDLVTAAVLAYVERPEFVEALTPTDSDDEAREALALVAVLEEELAQARTLAGKVVDGRMALSVTDFAVISGQLTEQIDAARARAQDATVPVSLRRVAGPGARAVWAASTLQERRAVIREVVRVTLNPAGAGTRTVRPGRVTWDWQW